MPYLNRTAPCERHCGALNGVLAEALQVATSVCMADRLGRHETLRQWTTEFSHP